MNIPALSLRLKTTLLTLFALCIASLAFGQLDSLGHVDFSSPEALFGSMDIIYGAVVILGGYLTAWIPGFRTIAQGTYRVLAWAIVTGIAFIMFGGADVWQLALAYASSTSVYEVILRLIFKSKTPDTE